jgi:hypothetical protein
MNQHVDQALGAGGVTSSGRRFPVAKVLGAAAALAVAAVVAAVIVQRLQRFEVETSTAVDDIENRLADLDPVTRAAVVARLSSDGLKQVRATMDRA